MNHSACPTLQDVLTRGPWSHLTCAVGTLVMVSEGAASTAGSPRWHLPPGSGNIFAREEEVRRLNQTPSPGLPQTPPRQTSAVSLRLLESGGQDGLSISNRHHHRAAVASWTPIQQQQARPGLGTPHNEATGINTARPWPASWRSRQLRRPWERPHPHQPQILGLAYFCCGSG